MGGCCAFGCTNRSERGFKMFYIPSGKSEKEVQRRKIWLARIKRENFKPTSKSCLCEVHFEPDQFERAIPGKLKPTAVPSIFSFKPPPKDRKNPLEKVRQNVQADVSVVPQEPNILVEHSYAEPGQESFIAPESSANSDELIQCSDSSVDPHREKVQELEHEINYLKRKLAQVEKSKEQLRSQLQSTFNADQITFLEKKSVAFWSDDTVKKALQLRLSCGSSGYNMLISQGLPFPSDRTLRRRIQNIMFNHGIIPEVVQMLSMKVQNMPEEARKVSLLIDEMAIQPSLEYDSRSKKIIGMPTIPGNGGEETLATHAMVFMLRGLATPWKQTLAYHFTGNSWSAPTVKELIIEIIKECHSLGTDVKGITMDMGGGNQGVLKELGIVCKRDGPIINSFTNPAKQGSSVYVFPDVPHLIKNLRNHISRGQYIYLPSNVAEKHNLPTRIVDSKHIEVLIKVDESCSLKLAPHLKWNHLHPNHFEKMKVAYAVNVLSRKTAAALRVLVEQCMVEKEALTTAWFLEQVSMWYDLMTSRSPVLGFSYFDPAKLAAAAEFLRDFSSLISSMSIGEGNVFKPVQKGITLATCSALSVKETMLNEEGYKFLLMRGFTQDALENLFSMIRFRNPVPNPLEFKNALRIVSLTQLLSKGKRGSYSIDPSVELLSREDIENVKFDLELDRIAATSTLKLSDTEEMALFHLAGFCVEQSLDSKNPCSACIKKCTTKERPPRAALTEERCYSPDALVFPTEDVFQLCKIAENVISDLGNGMLHSPDVVERLTNETLQRSEIKFPECHDIHQKIVLKFMRVKMFSYLRDTKELMIKKDSYKLKKSSEGSRSMAMRQRINN